LDCAAGKYSNTPGANNSNTCQMCPQNSSSVAASPNIEMCKCLSGTTGPNGQACQDCVPGTYKFVTGNSSCIQCIPGKYSLKYGAILVETCLNCEAGKYSPNYTKTNNYECQKCPQNSSSFIASSELTECFCVSGTTGPNGGSCEECIPGKYKILIGNTTCVSCPAGKYSSVRGANRESECEECPEKSSSNNSSTMKSDCKCETGTTGPDGEPCVTCEAGKYKDKIGNSSCIDCIAGKYLSSRGAKIETMCIQCPQMSNSTRGSITIKNCVCDQGFTGPDQGPCTQCDHGKYKIVTGNSTCIQCFNNTNTTTQGASKENQCLCNPGFGSSVNSSCSLCEPGKFKIELDNLNCTSCIKGKFSETIGGTTENICQPCPSKSISEIGSSNINHCKCNTGSHGPDGEICIDCVAGKYKSTIGSTTCENCKQGTYSTIISATTPDSCIKCTENSDSMPGSNEKSDCQCNARFRVNNVGNCYLIPLQETANIFQKIISFESDVQMDSLDPETKQRIEKSTALELDIDASRVSLITDESPISSRRRLLQIFRARFAISSISRSENDIIDRRITVVLSALKINTILSEILNQTVTVKNLEFTTILAKPIVDVVEPVDNTIVIVLGSISGILVLIVIIVILVWYLRKNAKLKSSAFNTLQHDYCEVYCSTENNNDFVSDLKHSLFDSI